MTEVTAVKGLSIPSSTQGASASSEGVFAFSCLPGDLANIKLYKSTSISDEITETNLLDSATAGNEYTFFVRGFDSEGNQVHLSASN